MPTAKQDYIEGHWGTSNTAESLLPLPPPSDVEARPLTAEETARIDTLSRLQFVRGLVQENRRVKLTFKFLGTAPTRWQDNPGMISSRISKFQLPNGECISCVLWNGLYHLTGTDIVRALAFRFEAFGRPIHATKKWEEGVFSDLRNLKPGQDACLEEPKSPLLDFLFRNGCIRTQKKQKVFYWFSVPHDQLFLDALERDLKREKANQEPTSIVVGEPARSFKYDPRRSLYDQFAGQNPGLNHSVLMRDVVSYQSQSPMPTSDYPIYHPPDSYAQTPLVHRPTQVAYAEEEAMVDMSPQLHPHMHQPRIGQGGSPFYKRRRMRQRDTSSPVTGVSGSARGPSVDMRDTESPENIGDESFASDESGMPPPPAKKARASSRAHSLDPREGDNRHFTCPYEFCRRPFKRLEHLKRHVRTHTQERPFPCERCPRTFSRQDNLAMHIKTHEKMDRDGGIMSEDDMRDYSESPGPDMIYDHYSRASSAMPPPSLPYTRHSTLPPNFPGAVPGGSPFHPRSVTPSYAGPTHMLGVPSFSPSFDPALRRQRSITPYAPVTSSNLAYAQPVIAPPVDLMGAYPTPLSAHHSGAGASGLESGTPSIQMHHPHNSHSYPHTHLQHQHTHQSMQVSVPLDPQLSAQAPGNAPGSAHIQAQSHMVMPLQSGAPVSAHLMPTHMGVGTSVPVQMHDYDAPTPTAYSAPSPHPAQYETHPTASASGSTSARAGAPSGWGWRSYEPGAFVPPASEQTEAAISEVQE